MPPFERLSKSLCMTSTKPAEAWQIIRDHHYSKRMPTVNRFCYVVRKSGGFFGWEGDIIAALVLGVPKARWKEQDFLELTRLVRIPKFDFQLTRLIAFACNDLKKKDQHLVISYANKIQKHHGGIYQAAGWNYHGERSPLVDGFFINGNYVPTRTCWQLWKTCSFHELTSKLPDYKIVPHMDEGKHLYWRALTRFGKTKAKRIGLQSNPYPKPAVRPLDEQPPRLSERGATPRDRSKNKAVVKVKNHFNETWG